MDIVINCPGQAHIDNGKPRILIIATPETRGSVKVQCRDPECKKAGGWYKVTVAPAGGITVEAIPKTYADESGNTRRTHFDIEPVPVAIEHD